MWDRHISPGPGSFFCLRFFWWFAPIGIADTKKVQVYLKERIFSVDQFIGVSPDLKSLLDSGTSLKARDIVHTKTLIKFVGSYRTLFDIICWKGSCFYLFLLKPCRQKKIVIYLKYTDGPNQKKNIDKIKNFIAFLILRISLLETLLHPWSLIGQRSRHSQLFDPI